MMDIEEWKSFPQSGKMQAKDELRIARNGRAYRLSFDDLKKTFEDFQITASIVQTTKPESFSSGGAASNSSGYASGFFASEYFGDGGPERIALLAVHKVSDATTNIFGYGNHPQQVHYHPSRQNMALRGSAKFQRYYEAQGTASNLKVTETSYRSPVTETGNVGNIIGNDINLTHPGSRVVTNAFGVRVSQVRPYLPQAGGDIVNAYGLFIDGSHVVGSTSSWGVYVQDPIENFFGGRVTSAAQKLTPIASSSLPAAGTAGAGTLYYCSDLNALVYSNGTTWKYVKDDTDI
jgi:hypothetical protein